MKITNEQIKSLVNDLLAYLHENELWQDVNIYALGKCWSTNNKECNEFRYGGEPFIYEDDPHRCIEYVADPHILTMSFEGPLYELLNYENIEALLPIFEKYGLWYEFGNAWNLTAYEG